MYLRVGYRFTAIIINTLQYVDLDVRVLQLTAHAHTVADGPTHRNLRTEVRMEILPTKVYHTIPYVANN